MSAKRLHKGSGSVDPTSLACETCLFVGLAPASLAVSKMDSTSYTALSWSTCPAVKLQLARDSWCMPKHCS